MAKKVLSRQRRWQLRQIAAGKCELCGEPREHFSNRCDKHGLADRLKKRLNGGFQPWAAMRGRTPFPVE